MKKVLAVVLILVMGGAVGVGSGLIAQPAHAEEQLMDLWPTQRALHDREMEITAKKYQERGQEYVDQLYSSHGEKYLPETDGLHNDLELPPMIETEPVDVNQVADMIKGMGNSQVSGNIPASSVSSPVSAPEEPARQAKTPMAAAAKALREERERAEQIQMMQAEEAQAAQ